MGVRTARPPLRLTLAARHPALSFLARRIGAALLLLLVVSILIFAGTQLLPGDVANAVLGRNATPEALTSLRHQLQLDQPASERYVDWLTGVLHGDLGESVSAHTAIWPFIRPRLANTAILALCTVLLMVPLALALGVLAATRAGRPLDHFVSVVSLAMISIPEFVTGTMLALVFATTLGALPALSLIGPGETALDNPEILILPIATLLAASLAQTTRMVRAGMIESLRSEYVAMARLNGFDERRVVTRYALRNALAPTVQVIALNIQWLVGGIVVTETVFGYPGIGHTLVDAVSTRDIPLVQSIALIIAAFYFAVNIVADLLVVFLIPKLRTAQ
ncbi:MAG TPA: ABC transporter permease [Thermoleophilaceae bacterium]